MNTYDCFTFILNKMKKLMMTAAIFCAAYGVSAQGFYADFNVGYGFGAPGRIHNDGTGLGTISHTEIVNGKQTVSKESINGGVGQGINLQLTPGYMFNDHIGVELGVNYYLGTNVKVQEATSNITVASLNVNGMEWNNGRAHAKSNQLRLIPTVVFSTGASNKVSGYAKLGLVMPVFGASVLSSERIEKEFVQGGAVATKTTESEMKVKGGFTVGFKGALGVNFNVTDRIGIFGEVFATALQINRKSASVTKYTVNGVDGLGAMTNYQRDTEYTSELGASSNAIGYGETVDMNKAKNEMTSGTNYNQVGLAVGVKFSF